MFTIKVSDRLNEEFVTLVENIQKVYTKEKAIQIDERLFDLYDLSQEEREAIGYIEIT